MPARIKNLVLKKKRIYKSKNKSEWCQAPCISRCSLHRTGAQSFHHNQEHPACVFCPGFFLLIFCCRFHQFLVEEVLLLCQDLGHNVGCECWNDRSPRHRSRSAKDSCPKHQCLDTRSRQRIFGWLWFYISPSLGNVREPDSTALHFHISCCSCIAPLLE